MAYVNQRFAVARYKPNGRRDFGFNPGRYHECRRTTTFDGSTEAQANAVAIDKQGRVVVAGYAMVNDRYQFALARYMPTGTLDTTFGPSRTGKVVTSFPNSTEALANALAINPKSADNIVAVGYATVDGRRQCVLALYKPDGNVLERTLTFGFVDYEDDAQARAVTIDHGDEIVVA